MILMRRRPPDPMLRWLLPLAAAWAGPGWAQVDVRLSKIDEGVAWVSPYWGYNAPKLIFDGTAYYTLGLWGAEQATARGAIYKLENGQWRRGYTWDGLNYQPGLLLLDGQQRLILIYPTLNGPPVVLRAAEPGQIDRFEPLPAPPSGKAGYMGAGIRAERLVIAYIGDPATYTFQLAVLDLAAQTWDGPFVLAPAQRRDEPFTTWLYPIVQPDATGIHLLVSNQPDPTARYDRILYMHLPYAPAAPAQPEVIAQGAMAFGEAMLQTPDGRIYVTAQYQPDEEATNQLYIFQRDPQARAWSGQALSPSQVAAVFHAPGEPARLWIPSTYGAQLRLYTSEDAGASWGAVTPAEFGGNTGWSPPFYARHLRGQRQPRAADTHSSIQRGASTPTTSCGSPNSRRMRTPPPLRSRTRRPAGERPSSPTRPTPLTATPPSAFRWTRPGRSNWPCTTSRGSE